MRESHIGVFGVQFQRASKTVPRMKAFMESGMANVCLNTCTIFRNVIIVKQYTQDSSFYILKICTTK